MNQRTNTVQVSTSTEDIKRQIKTLTQNKWRRNAFLKNPEQYKARQKTTDHKNYLKYQDRYKKEALARYHKNRDAINEKRRKN